MALALINESTLSDIADSIRLKLSSQDTYLPSEMPAAIESISGGGSGGTPELLNNDAYIWAGDPLTLYNDAKYLQASGHQYINGGRILLANDKVVSKWTIPTNGEQWKALYGSRNGSYWYNAHNLFYRFNNNSNFVYCRTGYESVARSTIYNSLVEIESVGSAITINGTTYTVPGTINDCVNNCGIFCLNASSSSESFVNDSPCNAKLHQFRIDSSDVTVISLLPKVRKADNKPGLYDTITGAFLVNIGSGEFGYELLDGTYVAPV